MNVLIVEDEIPKLEDLYDFFSLRYKEWGVSSARSVRSAIDAVRSEKRFDLLILDMSLPTFDITSNEAGGQPQGFGGIEVLRYLQKIDSALPVIVVTAFEAFTSGLKSITLDDLRLSLKERYPSNFKGAVYYNVVLTSWIEDLEFHINNAF